MSMHLLNPTGDALTACGKRAARRRELTTDRPKVTCLFCLARPPRHSGREYPI
jgi:hypothetical protein